MHGEIGHSPLANGQPGSSAFYLSQKYRALLLKWNSSSTLHAVMTDENQEWGNHRGGKCIFAFLDDCFCFIPLTLIGVENMATLGQNYNGVECGE